EGGIFDRRTAEWRRLEPAPLSGRIAPAVAIGSDYVFAWGGLGWDERLLRDGAVYSVNTGAWRPLPRAPLAPRGGSACQAIGDCVVVWGGWGDAMDDGHRMMFFDGAIYDVSCGSWP